MWAGVHPEPHSGRRATKGVGWDTPSCGTRGQRQSPPRRKTRSGPGGAAAPSAWCTRQPCALGRHARPCLWGNCCLDQVQSPGRVSSAPWGLGSLFVGKEQHLGVRLFLLEAFSLLPPVENKDSSVGVGEGCPLNPGGWMPGCTDEIGAPARGAGGCSWEERYSNIQATVSTTPWGEWGQGGRQTRPGGCAQGSLAPGE